MGGDADRLIAILDTTGGEDDDCLLYSYPRPNPKDLASHFPVAELKGVITAAVGISASLTAQEPRLLEVKNRRGSNNNNNNNNENNNENNGMGGNVAKGTDVSNNGDGNDDGDDGDSNDGGGLRGPARRSRVSYSLDADGFIVALILPADSLRDRSQLGAAALLASRISFSAGSLSRVFPTRLRDGAGGAKEEERAIACRALDGIASAFLSGPALRPRDALAAALGVGASFAPPVCGSRVSGDARESHAGRERLSQRLRFVNGAPWWGPGSTAASLSGASLAVLRAAAACVGGASRDPSLLEAGLVPMGAALVAGSRLAVSTLAAGVAGDVCAFLAANALAGRSADSRPRETWRPVFLGGGSVPACIACATQGAFTAVALYAPPPPLDAAGYSINDNNNNNNNDDDDDDDNDDNTDNDNIKERKHVENGGGDDVRISAAHADRAVLMMRRVLDELRSGGGLEEIAEAAGAAEVPLLADDEDGSTIRARLSRESGPHSAAASASAKHPRSTVGGEAGSVAWGPANVLFHWVARRGLDGAILLPGSQRNHGASESRSALLDAFFHAASDLLETLEEGDASAPDAPHFLGRVLPGGAASGHGAETRGAVDSDAGGGNGGSDRGRRLGNVDASLFAKAEPAGTPVEAGVLIEDPGGAFGDRFWVVGRAFAGRNAFFVCYHPSVPQSVVEIAFRVGFGIA